MHICLPLKNEMPKQGSGMKFELELVRRRVDYLRVLKGSQCYMYIVWCDHGGLELEGGKGEFEVPAEGGKLANLPDK